MTVDLPVNATTDVRRYVQWFDGALTAEFCAKLIDSFNQMPHLHTSNGRERRTTLNESAWTELNISPIADNAFKGFFFAEIDKYLTLYNERMGLTIPIPKRPRLEDLRIKRYLKGADEKFQPHFDSIDSVANRYLVFLWYLNDVEVGGETEFCDLGIKVQARTGRLLMFPPYWMFQHAGLASLSNDKYIISTYLLF